MGNIQGVWTLYAFVLFLDFLIADEEMITGE